MKICTFGLVVGVLLCPVVVCGDEQSGDWWLAERDVTGMLMQSGKSLAALVRQVNESPLANGQEAMFRLCVLTRAGASKESIQALHDIKRLCPRLDNYQVSSIYYDACDHLRAWDVAQAVVEVFADNVSDLSLDNRLLRHFMDSGWTIDRVDQWLASRPRGVKGFWVKERLRFNTHQGRGEALERELAERVRANPKDVNEAIMFLDGLACARIGRQEKPDLAWIVEAVKPELATDAAEIAARLVTLENWKTAAEFYRRAIATTLTEEEVRRLAMMRQVVMPGTTLRASFAVQTREDLADCLLKIEQAGEAQRWMLEAADIREKNGLGRNALLAGQVQGASGERVTEGKIKAEEPTSTDDPRYWSERAQYYRGRNETAQEEVALKKGLAIATPQPKPERMTKRGHMDWRNWLLADYAHFLAREKREEEAVALLRKEIAESPADSESSTCAAHMLAFDFERQLSVDDAVLWNWLKNRPKWEYTEERLLWRMLEKANRDDLGGYFSRAEELASGNDPSRAHTLGWIENRMGFPKRSIPLLEYAVKKAQDKELKDRAVFSLFESYLDTGDWQRAEAVFPDASRRLTPRELPDWHARIAVLAAKAGAKADAMRIWSRVANLDLSATGAIEQLVGAGLRDELIGFYRDMQKAIPSSEIPGKVLGRLGIQDATKPDAGDVK